MIQDLSLDVQLLDDGATGRTKWVMGVLTE